MNAPAADPAWAAERWKIARQHADMADLAWDPASETAANPSAFVTLAVTAGIAAADVICARLLGRYHAGENHAAALALLKQASPESEKHLARLLGQKSLAAYGARPVSHQRVKDAHRAYSALMDTAAKLL